MNKLKQSQKLKDKESNSPNGHINILELDANFENNNINNKNRMINKSCANFNTRFYQNKKNTFQHSYYKNNSLSNNKTILIENNINKNNNKKIKSPQKKQINNRYGDLDAQPISNVKKEKIIEKISSVVDNPVVDFLLDDTYDHYNLDIKVASSLNDKILRNHIDLAKREEEKKQKKFKPKKLKDENYFIKGLKSKIIKDHDNLGFFDFSKLSNNEWLLFNKSVKPTYKIKRESKRKKIYDDKELEQIKLNNEIQNKIFEGYNEVIKEEDSNSNINIIDEDEFDKKYHRYHDEELYEEIRKMQEELKEGRKLLYNDEDVNLDKDKEKVITQKEIGKFLEREERIHKDIDEENLKSERILKKIMEKVEKNNSKEKKELNE